MVTAIVAPLGSLFDVLAYENSPTPPNVLWHRPPAHLPTCRAHRSLPRGKAKARWSPMKKSVDGWCGRELLGVDEKVFVPMFLVKVIMASILLSL